MTLVYASCCVDSNAATSVTVPAVTSTPFDSSLKPSPRYNWVDLRVGSSCPSSHHLTHTKLRRTALLVVTGHTYAVALKTSGSEDCTCRSRNVCCLCQSVCHLADDSCSALRQRRRFRLCGRTSDDQRILHPLPRGMQH